MKALVYAVVSTLTFAAGAGCSIRDPNRPVNGQGQSSGSPGTSYTVSLFMPPIGGIITSSETPTPRINCGASAMGLPTPDANGVLQYNPVYYPGANRCGHFEYQSNEAPTLTAAAASGRTFYGWAGDCSGTGPCTLTSGPDRTIAAAFIDATAWTLSVAKYGGQGTISAAIPGQASAVCGPEATLCTFQIPITNPATIVTLTAEPEAGAYLSGWSGACSGSGTCVVEVSRGTYLGAAFAGGTPAAPQLSVAVSPSSPSLAVGQALAFTAIVANSADQAVTWSVGEAGGGSVSSAGLYTAPATPGVYHLVATAHADASRTATATVTVTTAQGVSVLVSPKIASVPTTGSVQLGAAVSGTSNTAVTWQVTEPGGGTVSAAGLYSPASAGVFHVVATSAADPASSDAATVTVTAPAPQGLAAQLAVLANHAIFFDHASVGENLMDGVRALLPTVSGPKPTVLNMDGGLSLNGTTGEWAEATHLASLNGNPTAKFGQFLADLDVVAGSGSKVDIAFMKLCFVDFTAATHGTANVASLFAGYQAMVASAQAAHPGIHFVHLTPPLETQANGAWNADRDAFGALLRNAYGADVFDLQLYESTNPDGSRSTSGGVPALAAAYTNDSGHLNATGQAAVVPALVQFLAGL
jgi:hypothetical protein